MGRGQIRLWPFFCGGADGIRGQNRPPNCLGLGQTVRAGAAAFEASGAEGAAGFWPDIVDGADQAIILCPRQLRAMAVLHRHVKTAFDLAQRFRRDRATGVLGKDRDIAGVVAKATGATGDTVRNIRGQSMGR